MAGLIPRAAPYSIELGDENSKPYKSIDRIIWENIPPFAVLTGPNGSGKTQLLQVLAHKISGVRYGQSQALDNMPFRIGRAEIGPHEIAYLPSAQRDFRIEGSSVGSVQDAKRGFLSGVSLQRGALDMDRQMRRERLIRKYNVENISDERLQLLAEQLPDDLLFMLDPNEVASTLGHVFIGYQVRFAERLMQRIPETKILEELGQPPWEFVNAALESAEFSYRIVPPENSLLKPYHPMVVSREGNAPLDFNDLSSGERTILRTVLWFYNSKHNNIFPKLFLLDEPDAHLHPSMTRQFIEVIQNVLVEQYGVRVILTTHSPSTVALSPEASLFVMSREQPRISLAASKAEAIGLLTSGLVIVSPGTRFVLVEDEGDVKFYSAVRDVLSDQGPSRDERRLKAAPSLVFMPASTGRGDEKAGGGRSVVIKWVNKFDGAPLNEIFRGIIDLDDGNAGTARVYVLKRHSVENYQLDPIIIFGLLIDAKIAPSLHGIDISSGDEHRLRTLSANVLNAAIEYVAQRAEPFLGALSIDDKNLTEVEFTNGLRLDYPTWMLRRRGRDLLRIYQKVFGEPIITPPRLESSFRRIRLVPVELADIMSRLQQR